MIERVKSHCVVHKCNKWYKINQFQGACPFNKSDYCGNHEHPLERQTENLNRVRVYVFVL